jgi:hypothetical protein
VTITAAGLAVIGIHRRRRHKAAAPRDCSSAWAGALFGVSNVAIKFLTHAEGPLHGC